jgi:hypothetical protein
MAELPGPFPYAGLFFVNRVTPRQDGIFQPVRLPEEIKLFRPFQPEHDSITIRLFVQNTIVLKRIVPENGKPVASPITLVK